MIRVNRGLIAAALVSAGAMVQNHQPPTVAPYKYLEPEAKGGKPRRVSQAKKRKLRRRVGGHG